MIFKDIENNIENNIANHCGCDEEDETIENIEKPDLMKKMSKKQMKKFPKLLAHSVICQSYYTARCEKCNGCDLAIPGCEKIFAIGPN